MPDFLKIPLVLTPQPEGGFTVTSPALPELITEGDSIEEVLVNVHDALKAALELYQELGKPVPENLRQKSSREPIWFEYLIAS
jgi:antitoxin HicB